MVSSGANNNNNNKENGRPQGNNNNVDNKENTMLMLLKNKKRLLNRRKGWKTAQKRAQKLKDNAQKSKEENASNARLREQKIILIKSINCRVCKARANKFTPTAGRW